MLPSTLPMARVWPVTENATCSGPCSNPLSVCFNVTVCGFQSLTVPSSPPLASVPPSGEKATESTGAW
jgi:hypothetical protein